MRIKLNTLQTESQRKVELAYSEKDRVIKLMENLEKDYNNLLDPKQRSNIIEGALDNLRDIEQLLDTSEGEKEIQTKAVASLTSMYDIAKAREWDRKNKWKGG